MPRVDNDFGDLSGYRVRERCRLLLQARHRERLACDLLADLVTAFPSVRVAATWEAATVHHPTVASICFEPNAFTPTLAPGSNPTPATSGSAICDRSLSERQHRFEVLATQRS